MTLPGGYWGQYLRVDLTRKEIHKEILDDPGFLRRHVGGLGVGAKLIYDSIPDGSPWDSPDNRVAIFPGPLAGSAVGGSGLFTATFKGAMTGQAGSTQGNGFFAAYLKLNGFDGLVIDGKADVWSVLVITEDEAKLIDGQKYLGLDTFDTQDALCADLGMPQASVYSIGPAGENGVRFAVFAGDKGHVCSKNGLGAVLGSKKLKAVVVNRGQKKPNYHDPERLNEIARQLTAAGKEINGGARGKYGTASNTENTYKTGQLPIKNYTTSLWDPHYKTITGPYMRETYKHKPKPCWACSLHVVWSEVTEGPYAGLKVEEAEYEGLAVFGPQIGNPDSAGALMLNDLADRLGLDCNETGWVLGWTMEAVEKGIFTPADLGGIDLRWGNVEAAAAMIRAIATRKGFGATLADGVMRAAKKTGRGTEDFAVGTGKHSTPRGHDHRGRWSEMLDTCLSNTGTLEAVAGAAINMKQYGLEQVADRFSPEEVSRSNAQINGSILFYDIAAVCRLAIENFPLMLEAINAATGWDLTVPEISEIGRRTVNRLRVFGFKNGLDPALERPSLRYCSAPVDGPVAGTAIGPSFDWMRANYWKHMNWTETEGRPLPETLTSLGLEELIPAVWPEK